MQSLRIPYPKQESEFDVQASLFCALRAAGLDARGEVKAKCVDFGRKRKVRFDIVVFNTFESAVVIIECKTVTSEIYTLGARQQRRYSQFGVPVMVCKNSRDIPKIVDDVAALVVEIEVSVEQALAESVAR